MNWPSEMFKVGAKVRYWTGLKEGPGREGEISYDGIYECGGTKVVYVRGRGAVALTHVEPIESANLQVKP
jgi:hypothetical protein